MLTDSTSGTFSGSGSLMPQAVAGMLSGDTYCQVDDPSFPSGEIRGQLPIPPPALPALPPSGVAILVVVLAGVGCSALNLRLRTRN